MAVGEALVVEAEQLQHRRMEVADVNRILDDVVGEVVGLAVGLATPGTAAGHPHREAARMVVAAVVLARHAPLGIDRPPKLTAPDNERRVEEAAALQILDEAPASLVDVLALHRQPAGDVGVGVPVVEIDLHEADAALHHAPRHQHAVGKRSRLLRFLAVKAKGALRLGGEIRQIGHARLHPKGHLVLRDAGPRLRIADLLERPLVERLKAVERLAAHFGRDAGGIVDVEDRVASGAEADAGVFTGEIAARPEPGPDRLHLLGVRRLGNENDERGEILIERAEAVAGPRSQAGAAVELVAGLHVGDRRLVVDRLGVHAANEAHLVGHARRVGKQFADPHPTLAMLGKLELRRRDREAGLPRGHRREPLAVADALGEILVEPVVHERLVVVEVHLRRPADHVQIDDVLRLRREVGAVGARHPRHAVIPHNCRPAAIATGQALPHQGGERRPAEEMAPALEEPAAREILSKRRKVGRKRVHGETPTGQREAIEDRTEPFSGTLLRNPEKIPRAATCYFICRGLRRGSSVRW